MFPLTNPFGQVVGFSARVYNGEDTKDVPKYINTKETKIFKKSEILFNYFKAKNNVRINKEIIIVEGQFDLLKCYGCGVTNIVATMGTAFTKEHAVLIKKLNAVPIILFDGDSAGEKGTLACGEELIKVGLNPLVVRLPNNDDPDSYISKNGQDKFLEVLNNRQSFIDFKLQYYKKNKDFKNTNDMATYVNTIIDELSKINDDVLKEITLKKIALESDLEIDFLRSKIKKQDPKEVKKTPLKKVSREEKALINLLFYMLKSTDAINIFDEADIIINNDKYRSLANEIVGFYKAHNYIKIADLMTTIKDDSEMLSLISEIGCLNLKDNFQKEEIYDYIKVIKEINLDKECELLKEKLKTVITKEEKLTITKKIEELIKEKMKSGGNYERD
jgi:DNA primase